MAIAPLLSSYFKDTPLYTLAAVHKLLIAETINETLKFYPPTSFRIMRKFLAIPFTVHVGRPYEPVYSAVYIFPSMMIVMSINIMTRAGWAD